MPTPRPSRPAPLPTLATGPAGAAGMTLLEVLVSIGLMAILAASMTTLVGAAIRSKLIVSVRSADTETARQTLEWMSERLRNAGLNLVPDEQPEARCRDMVVAQDAGLRPTAGRVFVSGEILNTDAVAGNEVITVGYYVAPDPVTETPVVVEYRQDCDGGAALVNPLSDPRIAVTELHFDYFAASGQRITALDNVDEIRRIRIIRITLTVEGAQGASGAQRQTWIRDVMLRNPEPNANGWKNPDENY